jgi:uncharacterized UBP type Zn finger protein
MYDDQLGPGVACGHVDRIPSPEPTPDPANACRECLIEGTVWVQLRRCLICGHVGCCESSLRRHATEHFRQTGHEVVASHSGDDSWGWCFADELALAPDPDRTA